MMILYKDDSQWFLGCVEYAPYNFGRIPALLGISGAIGMVPAFLIYTALLSQYPEIVFEVIPANFILSQLGSPVFQAVFHFVLLGTFVETGGDLTHGFNERIAGTYHEQGSEMPRSFRLGMALGLLIVATYIANAGGLTGLIAKGNGTITWVWWGIYVIPVSTLGIWRIKQSKAGSCDRNM